MKTALVTAPTAIPVTAAEAKTHLRVTGTDDDTLIERIIYAAVASAEQYLCRKLITQTWKLYLDAWPAVITLPFGNVSSVTHVKYTDVDEVQATMTATEYLADIVSIPGRIMLADGESWPTATLSTRNPIEVQFVTGYGAASTDVPQDIRHGIMMMVGHLYENRELILTGTIVAQIPKAYEALLYPHRVWSHAL